MYCPVHYRNKYETNNDNNLLRVLSNLNLLNTFFFIGQSYKHLNNTYFKQEVIFYVWNSRYYV